MPGVTEPQALWVGAGEHRAVGIGVSVLLHALVLLLVAVVGARFVASNEAPPAMRLVFVEPAPPPKRGVLQGNGQNQLASHTEPETAVPVAPAQSVAHAAPVPITKPAAKPRVAEHKPPAARSIVPKVARVESTTTGTSGPPAGVKDGDDAGVVGGLPGGVVGGLGSEPVAASQAAVPPTILQRVLPVYPERARLRGIEGQVMIEAVIATDGTVEPGIRVIQSVAELDAAALEAFRRWRFTPARDRTGKPLRVILQAPVRFVLR